MYKFTLENSGIGIIQIDDFSEQFEADLTFWSSALYKRHWKTAADALKLGNSVSFITSITNPKVTNFIRSWCCYPIKGELVFQECIIVLDQLEKPFDLEFPHNHAPKYESIGSDGSKISEWRTVEQ